jgi:tetratricopeptide (TPR) repeat protein
MLLLCLGAASASGEERALVRAEKFFDALEFDAASVAFEEALREPGTREDRLRAYKGLALSEAFMGQPKRAQAHFEQLLAIDPEATVSAALGPKIRKPFNAARKKVKQRGLLRAVLKVIRREDGQVEAVLEQGPRLVTEVAVYVRQPGEKTFKATVGPSPGPVLAPAPAVRAVEAYAAAPLRFDATEEPPPAVVSAQPPKPTSTPATATAPVPRQERRIPKTPLIVGGVGLAVAAGVVAGIILSKPPELKLPPADRTERLP